MVLIEIQMHLEKIKWNKPFFKIKGKRNYSRSGCCICAIRKSDIGSPDNGYQFGTTKDVETVPEIESRSPPSLGYQKDINLNLQRFPRSFILYLYTMYK